MKIGILFKNEGLTERDCTQPHLGNPGMGGSEWQRLLLGYYLSKNYHFDVCYYMEQDQLPPLGTHKKVCPSYADAVRSAERAGTDWFIINNLPDSKESRKAFEAIRISKISVIYICDCFLDSYQIMQIRRTKNIKKIVCVGSYEYRHLDKSLIQKAICIHLFHPMRSYPLSTHSTENIVMYQGALKEGKGFHVLAKIWKYITFFVPDAKLEILGSGTLYGSHTVLGKYGLAEASYEEKFVPHLLDKQNNIRHDVTFWGNKGGAEKTELMKHAKVGVMNPTAVTETWGLSASEFEAMGIPVVTRDKYGCKDSVKNFRGGLRFHTTFGFIIYIVLLLRSNSLNRMIGLAGRKRIGTIANTKQIAQEWYHLLHE